MPYACRTSIRNPSFQNACLDLTRLSMSDGVLVVRKIKGVEEFKDVSVVSPRTGRAWVTLCVRVRVP